MSKNGKILAFPDMAALDAEAAAWVARFDAADVSAQDQAAFQAWLNTSALHREAIAEYGNFWSEFDKLGQLTNSIGAGREFDTQAKRPGVFSREKPILTLCTTRRALLRCMRTSMWCATSERHSPFICWTRAW